MARTFSIGLTGFHHCMAGTVEVLPAVFLKTGIEVGEFVRFLTWAALGNALGGVFFVALIKYSHVVRSGPDPEGKAPVRDGLKKQDRSDR